MEHVIAGKAVCFKEALQPEFKEYQQQILEKCTGTLQRITVPWHENHFRWNRQSSDACRPNDPRSPFVTSGVRLGTPAVTTRGMVEEDMDVVREGIALVIKSEDNIEKLREMVKGLTDKYPLI